MLSAKQILALSDQEGFRLCEDNISSILLAPEVCNKLVIPISVAGPFRKGKSFLLNMMLRYLSAPNKDNWIDNTNSEQGGFPWQGGYQRHTTGILMWSEPIPVTLPNGDEAVIVLMDTQGTFDNESTQRDSTMVFALSTLLSSLQIFNLSGNLQSDDLQHLHLFTEYGRLALDDKEDTPFQKLLILIRDWQYDDELGTKGGDNQLKEWLHKKSGNKELLEVREHIQQCFLDVSGYLLPHPGKTIAKNQTSRLTRADMEPSFAKGLEDLMRKILAPETLMVKTIAGNKVTARNLAACIKTYFRLFSGDELPEPKTIFGATAEANNMSAVQEAQAVYLEEMSDLRSDNHPSIPTTHLLNRHRDATSKGEATFKHRKKMGNINMSELYLKQLKSEMEESFTLIEEINERKRELEKTNAEKHNMELVGKCQETYSRAMDEISRKNDFVSPEIIERMHNKAKKKAALQFDQEKNEIYDTDIRSRDKLNENIDASYRRTLLHNDNMKDVKKKQDALDNQKAAFQAMQDYKSLMANFMDKEGITDSILKNKHRQALKLATEMFELKLKGDNTMAATYRYMMEHGINQEFERLLELKKITDELHSITSYLRSAGKKQENPSYWGNLVNKLRKVKDGVCDTGKGVWETVGAVFGR